MQPAAADDGVEGVVAKFSSCPYRPGRRSGWLKIRQTATTEAAVLGVRGGDEVVLGRPARAGTWRAIGLSLPLPHQVRAELAVRLHPTEQEVATLPGLIAGLPGHAPLAYRPVRIEVVVEIEGDSAVEHGRYRHRPRVLRVRDDLTPEDLPAFPSS